jgi:hypothetical protein
MTTRDQLLEEYDWLCCQLRRAGAEPVVTDAVVEVFTDGELSALIRDSAMRLVKLRRFEVE